LRRLCHWPCPRGRLHYHTLLYFYQSWHYDAITPAKQKTYGRFSGTIFFGGVIFAEDSDRQQLANAKTLAKVKKRKKIIFSNEANPLFSCQNAQKKAILCCQYVFAREVQARLGVDGV
jgi:hypothetical protein